MANVNRYTCVGKIRLTPTSEYVTFNILQVPFWFCHYLDLLTSKFYEFTSVPRCSYVVNLVKSHKRFVRYCV